MTHSAQGLSRGGHSVEAGELRKQLFYRQGNGGFAKLMTAQSQRQQRRSQDTNPGSLALGTGHRPSPPAASLTDDTRRGEGHPAVPPHCPEMPLQGPRIVSPRTRIRTQTGSMFHSPQPPLPSPCLLFAAGVLPQMRLS